MSVEWRLPGSLAVLGAGKWIPSPVLGPTRLTSPSGRGGTPSQPQGFTATPGANSATLPSPLLTAPPLPRIAIVKLTPGERWGGGGGGEMLGRHMLHFNFCDFSGFGRNQLAFYCGKREIGVDVGKRGRVFAGRGGPRRWR